MANPERIHDPAPDDKLAALARAIAYELLQLGYRPDGRRGQVLMEGKPYRPVDPEIWQAMHEILAGGEP